MCQWETIGLPPRLAAGGTAAPRGPTRNRPTHYEPCRSFRTPHVEAPDRVPTPIPALSVSTAQRGDRFRLRPRRTRTTDSAFIHTLNHDRTSSAAPSRHARRERELSYHSRLVRVHALRFQSDNTSILLRFFSCNPPAYGPSRERHWGCETRQRTEVSGMAFESARRRSGGRSTVGRFG
jgi:hypothetical protein